MGNYTELYLSCQMKENLPIEINDIKYHLFGEKHSKFTFNIITKSLILTTRSDLKNYDQEIEKFLHWIAPYIESDDRNIHLGHFRNEIDEKPTLIFTNNINSFYT